MQSAPVWGNRATAALAPRPAAAAAPLITAAGKTAHKTHRGVVVFRFFFSQNINVDETFFERILETLSRRTREKLSACCFWLLLLCCFRRNAWWPPEATSRWFHHLCSPRQKDDEHVRRLRKLFRVQNLQPVGLANDLMNCLHIHPPNSLIFGSKASMSPTSSYVSWLLLEAANTGLNEPRKPGDVALGRSRFTFRVAVSMRYVWGIYVENWLHNALAIDG